MTNPGLDNPSFEPVPPEQADRAALRLLERRRDELQAVLGRHGVPPEEAPRLVAEALLAVGAEAGGGAPHGGRLLRALEVSCARWAAERNRAARSGADEDAAFASLLRSVARRLDERRRRLVAEQEAAPALVAELLAHDAEGREGNDRRYRFQTWAVVDRLLAVARDLCFEDPRQALRITALAAALGARLEASRYGTSALCDLRARIAMTAANARRILCDWRASEEEFDRAERLLDEGSLDPRLRAELLRLKAALRRAQRRLREAGRLLDQAMAIYRWIGDRRQQARVLLSKAVLLEHGEEEQEAAIALVEQALEVLDPEEEPRLQLVALHNLATHRVRLEDYDAAAELLPRVLELSALHGGRLDRVRVAWLQGLVALGRSEEGGEERLLEARESFVREGMTLDAGLVTLDLASWYLRQGRTAETQRLADEMLLLFRSNRVEREAMAALLIFSEAARLETATVSLARRAYTALERARDHAAPARPS